MRNVALHRATPRDGGPRSSDRVLQLLLAVGGDIDGVSLTEAAARVGLVPSTALRQLRSLEAAGLLVRDPQDQLYRPGEQLVGLARRVFLGGSLAGVVQPFLDRLAESTGESAYLAVAEPSSASRRRRASYIATAPGQHALRHSGWLGRSFDTAATAVGDALRGRTDDDGAVAREGSLEAGIVAVSAPIRRTVGGAADEVIAAISVIGPAFRLTGAELDAARRAVVTAAGQVSAVLAPATERGARVRNQPT